MIQKLLQRFDLEVPRDYVCIGLVTTGLGFRSCARGASAPGESDDDVIVQLGYCRVTGGRADFARSRVLNWTKGGVINPMWLKMKLKAITEKMEIQGKNYPVNFDMIRRGKRHPIDSLRQFVDQLNDEISAGKMLVGHNLVGFGLPVLADATEEWLGSRFEVSSNDILDLGIIEKARQLNEHPEPDEPLFDFFSRVLNMRGGGRWSMDHCCSEFGLIEKYPIGRNNPDSAGYKALTCHRLLEELACLVPSRHQRR